MKTRCETVSKALDMSTAIAIDLLEGLPWLKPETTLSEIGSRADVVECLYLNLGCEGRKHRNSAIVGGRSRSKIFANGQSSEIWR